VALALNINGGVNIEMAASKALRYQRNSSM